MHFEGSQVFGRLNGVEHHVGLLEFDVNGHIRAVNDRMLSWLGYRREEFVGQHHRLIVPASTASSEGYVRMWATVAAGTPVTGHFERVAKDGSRRWFAGTYVPLVQRDHVTVVQKIAIDVTTLREERAFDHQRAGPERSLPQGEPRPVFPLDSWFSFSTRA
jgi:methyl-accepting chemotaxis protein